jgi:hypothetical protein
MSALASARPGGSAPPGRERLWPFAAAIALAAAGLAAGRVAAFAAAPLACALLMLALHPGVGSDAPRRWVGAGLASTLAAAALLVAGAGAAALGALALGLLVLARGATASLRCEPPPRPLAAPPPGLALGVAVAADEALAFVVETTRRLRARPDFARIAADVRAAADRNREHGWLEHPERAHLAPPPLEKTRLASVVLRGAGRAEHLRFASEFEPVDPEVRDAFLAERGNATAHVHLWRSRERAQPTLVCLHDHFQGRAALAALGWRVRWLHTALGLDVALFTLPFYGPRAPRAGGGWLGAHPLLTSAALAQTVWDLRRLMGWLRAQGAPLVGLAGFGLGGHAAALYASLDAGLASVLLLAPVVSLDAFAWRLAAPAQRAEARAAGLTEHWLSAAWARHAPLRLRPCVPHGARLVVGGLADRLAPPAEVQALWEHWGRPACHWHPGSHSVWRERRALYDRLATHLRATLATTASR